MESKASERLVVQCACGARMKVPAAAIGRRVKCPKCNTIFPVALSEPVESPPASDWLADLAAQERAAPGVAAAVAPRASPVAGPVMACLHCGQALPAGAATCNKCGQSQHGGGLASVTAGAGALVAGAAGKVAKTAGKFMLGCVLSAVGAAVGAGIWYGVAMATSREIGFIAWVVGLLAGFGMALGSRTPGFVPGVVATAFALVSIVLAKLLVFVAVIVALQGGATGNRELQEVYVAHHAADAALREKGVDPDKATNLQRDAEYSAAQKRAKRLTRVELQTEADRYRAEDRAASEADRQDGRDATPSADTRGPHAGQESREIEGETEDAEISIAGVFFRMMFGISDIVFIVLAVASAFKVGSSGLTFGE